MKRLLPLILTMIGVLCMGFQCESLSEPIVNRGMWRVKNDTGQKVWIKPAHYDLGLLELGVGEEVALTSYKFPIHRMPEFGSLLLHWDGWAPENIYFSVLSADGSPLKEWNYTEAETEGGRHFFAERSWSRSQSDGERADEIDVTWVFTIEKGDVAPLPPTQGADDARSAGEEVRP